jgi:hypothetical protein
MSDNFPSGPWTGFYCYGQSDKHRMDLQLEFGNGRMSGGGNDDVGRFAIQGQYDAKGGECTFNKTYIGAHTVVYSGFGEENGIWGTWEIRPLFRGGFHIWPRRSGQGDETSIPEEVVMPVTTEAPAKTS